MAGVWVRAWLGVGFVVASACAMPNPAWKELGIGGSGSGSSGEIDADTEGSASTSTSEATSTGSGGGSEGGGSSTTAAITDGTMSGDATTEPASTGDPTTEWTGGDPTTDATEATSEATSEATTGEPLQCPCADLDVHLDDGIFVLADNDVLWKYLPAGAEFVKIGKIGCKGVKGPISMAVDRGGEALILYESPAGALRRIDVTDPSSCEVVDYQLGVHDYSRYAMAFASKDGEHPCEKLYGASDDGGPLAEGPGAGWLLDLALDEWILDLVGAITFNGAKLTGTGDGRLYLFGGVKTGKLVELDKATAASLEVIAIDALAPTSAGAFAFFGGDFYFFTESQGPGSKSKVSRFDHDGDLSLTVMNPTSPLRVVGAGVTTCVPLQ